MSEIIIYTTPQCGYCHLAKEYFKSCGLSYQEFDVLKDISRREEMLRGTGQIGVPVIKVNGQFIVGFNRTKIKEALGVSPL